MSNAQQMKECPSCALSVPANAKVCPECGDEIVHSSFISFVIIIIAPAVIAYGLFGDNAGPAVVVIGAAMFAVWLIRRQVKKQTQVKD